MTERVNSEYFTVHTHFYVENQEYNTKYKVQYNAVLPTSSLHPVIVISYLYFL